MADGSPRTDTSTDADTEDKMVIDAYHSLQLFSIFQQYI